MQQTFTVPQSWRPGARGPGLGRDGVSGGLSPGRADAVPSLCPHAAVPLRVSVS